MSNQVSVYRVVIQYTDGDEERAYKITDDYETLLHEIPNDEDFIRFDENLLTYLMDLGGYDALSFAYNHELGVNIDGTYYDHEDMKLFLGEE